MADNVLGISGQMDITDIQKSLDKLCDGLSRVGVDTDALSQQMTKALNNIAHSDADMSTKVQQAMQTLKTAMSEAAQELKTVPNMIDNANQEVKTIEGTISTLNTKLNETEKNSSAFNSIAKQIDVQNQLLRTAKESVKDLSESYNLAKNAIAEVNGAYQTLSAFSSASAISNSANSIANTAVSASSVAASAGLMTESAAHASNAANAMNNTNAVEQNAQATQHLTSAIREYLSTSAGRADVERMQDETTKELKADIKLYEDAIKEIQTTLDSVDFAKKIEDASSRIEQQKSKIEAYKEALSKLTPEDNATGEGANYYNHLISDSEQKIIALQAQISNWESEQQRLNADLQEYNTLLEAAKQIQEGKTLVTDNDKAVANIDTTSASEYTQRIDDAKTKLQELEAEVNKFSGQKLTDKQKEELENLNYEIAKTKEEISSLKAALREKNEETFIGKLRNKLSDAGTKISDFGQSLKEKIQKPFEELSTKFNDSSFIQRFKAELEQAKLGLNSFKDGVVNVMTANGKFQQQIGVIGEAFKGLGIPIGGSLTAIKSVTKALWAMCATPVGAVIAAIALAFKAVHTWMTKSTEGQLVYTKLMAYFGSLAKSITDIVVILGGYLYHCFTDANAPLKDFGNNFVKTFKTAVTTVVNLISGLGTAIKGVLNMDWDTFTGGLKQTWDGIKGAGETLINGFKTALTGAIGVTKTIYKGFTDDKLGKDLSSVSNSMTSNASKAASLAGQIQQIQIAIKQNSEDQLKLDKKIAEQKNKIYTLQGKEKIAAIETTKELIKQKYEKQIKQQQQLADLSAKNAKLHTQSLETLAAERELRKDILKSQIQISSEQRMLVRQEESAKRKISSSENTAAKKEAKQDAQITSAEGKLSEVEYKNDYARLQVMQAMEQKIADAKIEAMEEGDEKVLAQRKRQLEKEIEQIEKEKEAAVKAERDRQKAEFDARQEVIKAKGGKKQNWNEKTDLDTTKISAIYSQYDEYSRYKIQASNQEILKKVTDKYKTAADERLEIKRQYDNDIKAIQEARAEREKKLSNTTDNNEREKLKNEIDKLTVNEGEATKKKGEALISFDFAQLKKDPEYTEAFENLKTVSSETLEHLIKLFSDYKAKAGEAMNPEQLREYMNTYQQMQDELLSRGTNPFAQIIEANARLNDTSKEVKNIQQYIKTLDKKGQKTKETIALEKKLNKSYGTREEAETSLRKAMNKQLKEEEKARKAKENLKKDVDKLASSISNLGSTIGGTEGKILQLIGNVLSFVTTSSESMQKVAQTGANAISTIEKASVILTIISAAIQLMQQLDELIPDAHESYEKYAAEIKEVNDLTDAVNNYTLAAMKAQQAKEKWFATTDLINLKDAYEYSNEALDQYYKKLLEKQAIYENETGSGWLTKSLSWVNKILGWTTPFGLVNKGLEALGLDDTIFQKIANWSQAATGVAGAAEHVLGQYLKEATYEEGTTSALNNLRIETRSRSRGFLGTGIGGHNQETQDLVSWVKENYANSKYSSDLFDDSGLINLELANNIIENYGDKLVGETKETLEELIELRKSYDEFVEKLEEYVSEAFSPLTDNLTDALWDWLEDGEDVMDKFKEYASDTFADIAKQIVKSAMVSTFFSKYQDEIEETYKLYSMKRIDEKKLSSLVSASTKDLMSTVETNLPMLQELLKTMDAQFQQLGIAISGTTQSEQEATTKALEAITQDQASNLIGIAYAMQIALEHGNEIQNNMCVDISSVRVFSEQISNNITEMRDIQYEGLGQLQQIAKNTSPITDINESISLMYKLMKEKY